jgi:hypothetical protein
VHRDPVEFVELNEDGSVLEPPPAARTSAGPRRVLAAVGVLAVLGILVTLYAFSAVRRPPAVAVAAPAPAVSPAPSPAYRRATIVSLSAGDVRSVCPVGQCSVVQLTYAELRANLAPFGPSAYQMGGATVYDEEGDVAGRVINEVRADGSSVHLVMTPASGPPKSSLSQSTWFMLTARRNGWDLSASLGSHDGFQPSMEGAQTWLHTAALPDSAGAR